MIKTCSAKIESIYCYPVKSLAGISLKSSKLNYFGLVNDRQWMLVDDKGVFLSQRKLSKMATISTAIRDGKIFLSKPGLNDIEVKSSKEKRISVSIWKDRCDALVATDEVNTWLDKALETKNIQCVQFIPSEIRTPAEPLRFGETARHFADGSPFLVSTVESLSALNTALLNQGIPKVDMRNFRPNIVVSGIDAFAEHDFTRMQVTGASDRANGVPSLDFTLVDHCQRCSIITVNPDTGEYRAKGTPLIELAKLNGMPNKPRAPAFGVNATLNEQPEPQQAELAVGQDVVFS